MKRRIVSIVVAVVLFVGLMPLTAQPAMALEGPEGSPPGGYTINDTDTGNGEQWGRAGGRDITFSNIQLTLFNELLWGLASGNDVGIAFDGAINAAGETLSYNAGESTLASGIAVWTGQTQVSVTTGSPPSYTWQPIDTKFILTVTDSGGNPVILTTAYMGLPQADLTSLTPDYSGEVSFTAKLEMQARYLSAPYLDYDQQYAGSFGPALDVFDCLKTQTSHAGWAITEFNWGFFYELADTFDLAEHDAHITGLIGGVETKVDDVLSDVMWLVEDWSLVKPILLENLGNILGGISGLAQTLSDYGSVLGNVNSNIEGLSQAMQDLSNDVDQVSQQQNNVVEQVNKLPNLNTLLLLFGIEPEEVGMPPDPNLPPFEFVAQVSDLYQTLNALSETPTIDVQVISVHDKKQFLLLTTEAGQPVTAQLVSLQALTVKGKKPVEVQDVTASTTSVVVGSGILDVTVDLPKSSKGAEVFVFTVEHSGVYGAIMIDHKGDNASN